MSAKTVDRLVGWGALCAAVVGVFVSHLLMPPPRPAKATLPRPADVRLIKASSVGEPEFAAQLSALYVQSFDAQLGIKGTLNHLDYAILESWLNVLTAVDRSSDYALQMALMASRVNDAAKKRRMLEYVHRAFLENPNRRWRTLAEAAVIARHELKDLPLALNYSESLERHATGPGVPGWAQQMHALMLADIGESERARIVLGGLIASGKVHNAHELRLLEQRLLTP